MLGAVYGLFAVAGLAIIISMLKSKKFFAALIMTALQGVIAIFAANFAGSFFGVHICVNPQTLTLSALGGIPAVVFLLVMETFFVK